MVPIVWLPIMIFCMEWLNVSLRFQLLVFTFLNVVYFELDLHNYNVMKMSTDLRILNIHHILSTCMFVT